MATSVCTGSKRLLDQLEYEQDTTSQYHFQDDLPSSYYNETTNPPLLTAASSPISIDTSQIKYETPSSPSKRRKLDKNNSTLKIEIVDVGKDFNANGRVKAHPCPYPDCDKIYSRPTLLQDHINSHTGERPHKCPFEGCDKTFISANTKREHIKDKHGEEDHICDHPGCDKTFSSSERLRRHKLNHKDKADRSLVCTGYDGCNQVFRKKSTLRAHINEVHLGKLPYYCTEIDAETGEICGKGFDKAYALKQHIEKQHKRDQPFGCDACKAILPDYVSLRDHIRQEHLPKCPHCDFIPQFGDKHEAVLQRHIRRWHMNAELDEYICPKESCGKSFTSRRGRDGHIRMVHDGVKEFMCGITDLSETPGLEEWKNHGACYRPFTSKQSLQSHVFRLHVGDRAEKREKKLNERREKRKKAAEENKEEVDERRKAYDRERARKRREIARQSKALGNGEGEGAVTAPFECIVSRCHEAFHSEQDLAIHFSTGHGMDGVEIAEALAERQALSGGDFWYSNHVDDVEESGGVSGLFHLAS